MLSPVGARTQRAAGRSWVCLNCRLNAESRMGNARQYSNQTQQFHQKTSSFRSRDGNLRTSGDAAPVVQENLLDLEHERAQSAGAKRQSPDASNAHLAKEAFGSSRGRNGTQGEARNDGEAIGSMDADLHAEMRHERRGRDRSTTSGARKPRHRLQPGERRSYHTSLRRLQQTTATLSDSMQSSELPFPPTEHPTGIRAHLRRWQELNGEEAEKNFNAQLVLDGGDDDGDENHLTKLTDARDLRQKKDEEQDEAQAMAYFTSTAAEDMETDQTDPRFLHMGDLVELEFASSEKPSLLAIFVRRNGPESQFYTIQGRWVHLPERQVQYAIPGWVSPELVEPIVPYLPTEEQMEDIEALQQEAYHNDLSVPRRLGAPLVTRMIAFQAESLELYRKHATALDNAHKILAHDSDLRYGSLTTAATALLKIPADQVSLVVLYTVRKALMDAGFAFNVDRRSHRLTGYLQIRSKEQVKMVETVRMWLREWQDDLASTADMSQKQLERRTPKRGAIYVNSFLKKARKIIEKSRDNREPTRFGNVGPSKVRYAITPEQQAVKITSDTQFDAHDEELARFIEAWACNNMFVGLPRISALPPLLLQASGMYSDEEYGDMSRSIGFMFLQEIGTIMPYDNRVRFDQHLLLPSSQHSKPLQNLMTKLMDMRHEPDFHDNMAELRHDWGDLPVYCIDAASAHEIDDGISIERAESSDDKPEWWVHIHIANPTAFFNRDHPLAKMARHMGESIYMPERAYKMLPAWASHRHFSLGKNRPCLTFSARMNQQGEMLDKKVTSGTVRNVLRITPSQVKQLLGLHDANDAGQTTLTVGGDAPVHAEKENAFSHMTETNIAELRTLQNLATGRTKVREAAGGVFFDQSKPELTVWQIWKTPGLSWDHPHRRGSRTVEGDPIIQMTASRLTNWFTSAKTNSDIMVREMMLLACEISTAWCAERQIPTLYRGSVPKPDQVDSATFYKEVCEPAMARNGGEIPLHLGLSFIQTQGSVVLSTRPLKHNLLGLNYYGKVTSPLRRYGDMILHWQIEAVLREEARLGRSLVSQDPSADRSFLPFSRPVLETIATGLQPRESMITRAKWYAEHFWTTMLMFRAHHYGETELPFKTLHAYVARKPFSGERDVISVCEELNIPISMGPPEKYGLPAAKVGDRWECVIDEVKVYYRYIRVKPIRLVERWEY